MRILGIIPARGGSKGVPGKNVRLLGGKPLIAHTIEAAGRSGLTRCILSTDDPDIADIGRSLGADVPFIRPAALATDSAKALPVIQQALATVEAAGDAPYDAVMMLQPTTPFRETSDIDGAIALLVQRGADSVISVVEVGGHHPARMKYLEGDRLVDPPFAEAYENQPRQELRPMYIRNGAIYLTRRHVLLSDSFKGQDCRAWVMPVERSVNIDTLLDFDYAEFLYSKR
ncbi:MAG: acylneuraminate cytidylyltransferase family protein [Bacteroidia bacterium]